jgi:hypothetical protein
MEGPGAKRKKQWKDVVVEAVAHCGRDAEQALRWVLQAIKDGTCCEAHESDIKKEIERIIPQMC